MLLEIVLVYIAYLFVVLAGTYYVTMFNSKDVFTKEDIKNVLPFIFLFISRVNEIYQITIFFAIMIVSSFIGIVIPMIFKHWIVNSSILFILVYFTLPIVRSYLEKSQVTDPENYSDALANLVIKFTEVIIFGFGAGMGSALIYNWRSLSDIHSMFFLFNIAIISIFIGYIVNIIIKE